MFPTSSSRHTPSTPTQAPAHTPAHTATVAATTTPDPAPHRTPDDAPDVDGPRRRALVHLGRRRWVLEPGQSVSFGRGSPCDIRIAHDPVDEHVSRRAGVVEYLGEDVVVRNESATRALIFHPARGSERVIRPGEAITCLPHREFLVGLSGRGGSQYVLQVTADLTVED